MWLTTQTALSWKKKEEKSRTQLNEKNFIRWMRKFCDSRFHYILIKGIHRAHNIVKYKHNLTYNCRTMYEILFTNIQWSLWRLCCCFCMLFVAETRQTENVTKTGIFRVIFYVIMHTQIHIHWTGSWVLCTSATEYLSTLSP